MDVPGFLVTSCFTHAPVVTIFETFLICHHWVPAHPSTVFRGHPVHRDLLTRPREKRWWRMTDCREKAHFHVPHSPTERDHSLLANRALLTDQMRPLIGALQLGEPRQERESRCTWAVGDANQGRGENWLAWLSIIHLICHWEVASCRHQDLALAMEI